MFVEKKIKSLLAVVADPESPEQRDAAEARIIELLVPRETEEERCELADAIHMALAEVAGIYDTTDEEDHAMADKVRAAGFRRVYR